MPYVHPPIGGSPIARPLLAAACLLTLAGCSALNSPADLSRLDQVGQSMSALKEAAENEPGDPARKIDYLLQREQRMRELLRDADDFRAQGEIEKAGEIYGRILHMDPAQASASAGLLGLKQDARYLRQLADGEAFLGNGKADQALERANQVLDAFPRNIRANALRDAARDAMAQAAADSANQRDAQNVLDTPVTLQFADTSLRHIFEALAKSTGINVLFDKDVKQDAKATLLVRDVTLSDAIDLLMLQNRLRKRIINGNTLMIYPVMSGKSEEYDDMEIRTFQVSNTDIRYLSGMLKTMLRLKEISADEKTGVLIIRDTPEMQRIAERLIASHDVPDPEIMLEIEVLEVTKSRTSDLGIDPPSGVTLSTPGGAAGLTLGALQRLSRDDLISTPLSATVNFRLSDADTKILASPRIRARNREPAKIMIGDRIPTVTNTVTSVSSGAPVVTGSVSYQDVGLKLEFESQVYANSEVGIKMALEVSNIVKVFTDDNGSRSYQIGTRNASTNLRLKDGETQILGGLISDHAQNSADLLPGLGHLPIVGKLFGNNSGSTTRSEIVLAVTPHIIRDLPARAPEVKRIYSGTYNSIRERPILADAVTQIKVSGGLSGDPAAAAATSKAVVNAIGLPPAPPMLQRPAGAP